MLNSGRILAVDDDDQVLRFVATALERAGFRVDCAAGRTALKLARSVKYDGMVADLCMPEMSALEMMATLSSEGVNLPTLIIAGGARVEDAVEAMKLGAFDVLSKPLSSASLVEAVRRMLDGDRRPRTTPLFDEVPVQLDDAVTVLGQLQLLLFSELGTQQPVATADWPAPMFDRQRCSAPLNDVLDLIASTCASPLLHVGVFAPVADIFKRLAAAAPGTPLVNAGLADYLCSMRWQPTPMQWKWLSALDAATSIDAVVDVNAFTQSLPQALSSVVSPTAVRDATGKTFLQWRRYCRVRHSCVELSASPDLLKQVCFRLQYKQQAHLTHDVNDTLGISPGELRLFLQRSSYGRSSRQAQHQSIDGVAL